MTENKREEGAAGTTAEKTRMEIEKQATE